MARKSGVEIVRGRIDGTFADELVAFWTERDALTGERAQQRVAEVVCVARLDGQLAGVCSAYAADVPLIAGRRFWIYRSLLDEAAAAESDAMIRATFRALETESERHPGGPIGLCVPIADPTERRRRPEAEWSDPRMIYAGYLRDGRQVRIGYFGYGARQTVDRPLEHGYRIALFTQQDEVTASDVIELWTRHGVLPIAEAERRVGEVLLVATDGEGALAGVGTAYVARNDQLRAMLWYYRTFVSAAHRQSNIAAALAVSARDHLEHRFVSGEDVRAIGVIFEVESELLKRRFPDPVWRQTDVFFIGETAAGAEVRVHYFPGALAPEPDA